MNNRRSNSSNRTPVGNPASPNLKHGLDWANFILACFTFIFAVVAAVSTFRAAKYALKQTNIAEDNERRQLRAYLSAGPGPSHTNKIVAGEFHYPYLVAVTIKNTGQTPAYKVSSNLQTGLFAYPLPTNFDFSPYGVTVKSSTVLTPNEETSSGTHTAPQLAFITPGADGDKTRLYMIGQVTYTDAFDNLHYSNFCMATGGKTLEQNIADLESNAPPKVDWELCPMHNDAD